MAENNRPQTRTAADKEKSRQQSRSVSGKQAAKATTTSQPGKAKQPGQAGGASQRAAAQRASTAQRASGQKPGRAPRASSNRPASLARRSPTTLLTWGTVALVVVIVLVFVLVKVVSGSSNGGTTAYTATPANIVQEVTSVPASVFDKVGITATTTALNPPSVITGQPALKFGGKPGLFYFGAEFCPYCAAERWVLVVTLARFGTLSGLGNMTSSSSDIYPSTPTFTFSKATFSSKYLAAMFREYESSSGTIFQRLTSQENSIVNTYDSGKFVNATAGQHPFPFVDVGGVALVSGAAFTPGLLSGLTRDQIAAGLNDSKNPVTQEIIASSNYLAATICVANHGGPASVCNSSGVKAALKSLKLKIS